MEQALELHRTGQIRVLPIILQPVDWEGAPFSTLQMLPTDAKPVTAWANQEDALKDIAKNIRGVVRELQSQKK